MTPTPHRILEALGRTPDAAVVVDPSRGAHLELARALGAGRLEVRPELPDGAAEWDVVVLAGALEAERWDRWLLQRTHRALRPGGVLACTVPNLLDVTSWDGLRYLAGGVRKQLRRWTVRRGAIPAADRTRFRGRRYRAAQLVATCEALHFRVVSCASSGHGLGPLGRALSGAGRTTGRGWELIARREPSLWGEPPARAFPPAREFVTAYETAHAESVSRREDWISRHGARSPEPLELDAILAAPVVVFSPHPDDELIGCGGTLLALAARGARVTIVQVTDGSDSAAFIDEPDPVRRQIRLTEAERVARGLGAAELVCLRADNRAFRATRELETAFGELLERLRPGLVFAPALTDFHPDHQTVNRLLAGALARRPDPLPRVATYEVWGLVAPTHHFDCAGAMARLEALLLEYETALKVDDYVHLVAARLLYNSYRYAQGPGYLEVYRVLEGGAFARLVAERAPA